MTVLSIAGFATAMFLLAITPGPGVFATISKSLSSGFRSAVPVILGIVAGDLIFLLFAIYGLSAIAETFNILFQFIKYAGAAYLIWLGVKLWRSAPVRVDGQRLESQETSSKSSFLGGLSITLGNPKVILFYMSFLPTFVDLTTLTVLDVGIIATVLSLVLGGVMLFYAYAASKVRRVFKSEKAQTRMNRSAGLAMIGTGTTLIVKS